MRSSRNIAAEIAARTSDLVSLTTANDGSEIDGGYVDRQGYESAALVIFYEAALTEGETLSIAANVQDDADGAGAGADFGDALANAVVATGGSGGSTERGTVRIPINLSGAKRYIRAQYTLSLSAGSSDTVLGCAAFILGGAQEVPTS